MLSSRVASWAVVLACLSFADGAHQPLHAQAAAGEGPASQAQPRQRLAQGAGKTAQPAAPAVAMPQPEEILVAIRHNLVALNHANLTGDYGVLYKLAAPDLRSKLTLEQLAAAFAKLREQKIDMSPINVVTPQLTEAPEIVNGNILRLVGFFPTAPLQIKFTMLLQHGQGGWKLLGVDVSTFNPSQPNPAANQAEKDQGGKKGDGKKAPDKK